MNNILETIGKVCGGIFTAGYIIIVMGILALFGGFVGFVIGVFTFPDYDLWFALAGAIILCVGAWFTPLTSD